MHYLFIYFQLEVSHDDWTDVLPRRFHDFHQKSFHPGKKNVVHNKFHKFNLINFTNLIFIINFTNLIFEKSKKSKEFRKKLKYIPA